jgi:hypothetical protein
LHVSGGGEQAEGPGSWQVELQAPEPVDPQDVVQATVVPMMQLKVSSRWPLQLSSSPLHISTGDVGTQSSSQLPSPSRSAHPSSHTTAQEPDRQAGSAFLPAVHALPQDPQL